MDGKPIAVYKVSKHYSSNINIEKRRVLTEIAKEAISIFIGDAAEPSNFRS